MSADTVLWVGLGSFLIGQVSMLWASHLIGSTNRERQSLWAMHKIEHERMAKLQARWDAMPTAVQWEIACWLGEAVPTHAPELVQ